MTSRRFDTGRSYGNRDFGAPSEYFSRSARQPRESYLSSSRIIQQQGVVSRTGNRYDEQPHNDDYLTYTRETTPEYTMTPEEKEEAMAERKRRQQARNDVILVENFRSTADLEKSKFHAQEELVQEARITLEEVRDADNSSRKAALEIKKADLTLRMEQETCISQESVWLAAEIAVEVAMVDAEMNKIGRYEERNEARAKIEQFRADKERNNRCCNNSIHS